MQKPALRAIQHNAPFDDNDGVLGEIREKGVWCWRGTAERTWPSNGRELGSEGGAEEGEAQPGLAIRNVDLVPAKFKHRILNAL